MNRPWSYDPNRPNTNIAENRYYTASRELGYLNEEMAEAILARDQDLREQMSTDEADDLVREVAAKLKAIIAKADAVDPPRVIEIARELESTYHKREAIFDEWYTAPDMLSHFLGEARRMYAKGQADATSS